MCGILGIANARYPLDGEGNFWDSLLKMRNRGPDVQDVWKSPNGNVLLGHTRLSILDLSDLANQPMVSECGRFVIVFNGEIYNFKSLKNELIDFGVNFLTTGDTEVVLAAYKVWGDGCLARFNGMFAFAIYDRGTSSIEASIFVARDRAGEKPLYYSIDNSVFRFASELKGINHSSEIDLDSLNFYLRLGFIPGDMCLFMGVNKLPPAHFGRFMLNSGKFSIQKYWSLPINYAVNEVAGLELAYEAGQLIEDSVRLRLVADVPVGILLSGGLDSSLVTAAAARVSGSPVETFTITLPGSSLDEAAHAKKIASYFGTHHHELPLDKSSFNLLDGLAPYIDEPIADSSILPAWLVFGMTRKSVTVALGGDGGDELFGGYSSYKTVMTDLRRFGYLSNGVLGALSAIASHLPAGLSGRNKLASLSHGPLYQFVYGTPYFDLTLRNRLLKNSNNLGININAPEQYLTRLLNIGSDPVDRMTRADFMSVLPDDFLVKVDRASMANSLEVRAPMLDHRLIEFAFSKVPSSWKVKNGETRILQRLLAQHWLPADLDVKRKQGFSIPINEWMRAEGEKGLMARMDGMPDEINMDEVKNLVRGHISGRSNGGRLFALIMLAIAIRNKKQ